MTSPRMRAGTGDWQSAVDGLTRHFTESRLDPREFDERVGQAYAATYLDELLELFADLPEAAPHRGNGPGAGWPDPDRPVPVGPVPIGNGRRPGPWSGPPPPAIHRRNWEPGNPAWFGVPGPSSNLRKRACSARRNRRNGGSTASPEEANAWAR